jgi:hypothetical protein
MIDPWFTTDPLLQRVDWSSNWENSPLPANFALAASCKPNLSELHHGTSSCLYYTWSYIHNNIDLLDGGIGYFGFSKNIFNSQLCSQISWLGHNLERDHTYIYTCIQTYILYLLLLMFGTKIICNLRSSCKKGKTFIDIGWNCWKLNSQLVTLTYLLFQPLGGYYHKFTQQNKRCTLHCGSAYVEILEN